MAFLAACLVGLGGGEWLLRWKRDQVRKSDNLDRGLVRFDADFGWSLTPGWTGRHRHHDFEASYSISPQGFRSDPTGASATAGRATTLVVGDSFTFGLGVNDDETFVHRLNQATRRGGGYLNCGVPGYSTDQEVLMIESRLLDLRPQRIVLVVYVANDLFDNLRPAPMQVGSRKPYFELVANGQLLLRGHPVELENSRVAPEPGGLLKTVLGPDRRGWTLRHRLEQESELFRTLSQSLVPETDQRLEFAARFNGACTLFAALIDRLNHSCRPRNTNVIVATLAGRSFFETPGSISAQYQEYLLDQVAAICARRGLQVIDLPRLMQRGVRTGTPWFFRNDGHLTADGHREIARHLAVALAGLPATATSGQ